MPKPRLSSAGKSMPAFPKESEGNPNGIPTVGVPHGTRVGSGRGSGGGSWKPTADALSPLTERRAKEFAWAEQHLPGEHPGMVVSALIGLEVAGQKQSTQSVMARLEGQGRTAEQRRANDKARGRA